MSICLCVLLPWDSLMAQMVKPLPAMRETHSIPGLERSPGEGNGNPLQYSCLENSMDGGAWWATVHGVAKNWTRLSNFTSLHLTSAFFIVQCSHPYMTTGKNKALTRQTFVGKVMSLLLNMLSRLVTAFLPRSTHLLIS